MDHLVKVEVLQLCRRCGVKTAGQREVNMSAEGEVGWQWQRKEGCVRA